MDESVATFAKSLFARLPMLAIWIVGGVVALVRWQRHPRVSLCTVIAVGTLCVLSLVGMVVSLVVVRSGMPYSQVGVWLSVWGGFHSVAAAGSWALILVALFGWRSPPGVAPGHH